LSDVRRITERLEREEFARGHIGPDDTPVDPRPAATIVVACRQPDGRDYRVLLLRRPESARFAAGAYVFPGGVIDEADGEAAALSLLPERLRAPEGPALVAALRELFEETGLLLADAPVSRSAARRWRRALLEEGVAFHRVALELGATFRLLEAAYVARWITPARFARRYDTRFFLAVLDAARPPRPRLTGELAGYVWLHPREAVRRFAAGELPMLFPTRTTLQTLAGTPDLMELVERCDGREPVPIEPRLLVRGEAVRPVLPGDPEFDAAR